MPSEIVSFDGDYLPFVSAKLAAKHFISKECRNGIEITPNIYEREVAQLQVKETYGLCGHDAFLRPIAADQERDRRQTCLPAGSSAASAGVRPAWA